MSSNIITLPDRSMTYSYIGLSGLKVSTFGIGTYLNIGISNPNYNRVKFKDILILCKKYGVNYIDSADTYYNGEAEIELGIILKELNWKRSSYVISSKIFWGITDEPNDLGLSRKHLVDGLNDALERLQLNYIDLLYCHRYDPYTPMIEICDTMNNFIKQGKILYWGTSEWPATAILHAISICEKNGWNKPICEQVQHNMISRNKVEAEYMSLYSYCKVGISFLLRDYICLFLENRKFGVVAFSPLASGFLTNKYINGIESGNRLAWVEPAFAEGRLAEQAVHLHKLPKLNEICQKLNCSMAQLALAWVIKNENVHSILLGVTNESQLIENIEALAIKDKLTNDIMVEIESILQNSPKQEPVYC